jgi:molecular chaperone Hsp33
MSDVLVRGIAYNSGVRVFAAITGETVESAIQLHGLNPVAAIALGRALTVGAMISSMGKGSDVSVTIQVSGDGPMQGLIVIADNKGILKGYVYNNDYESYGDAGYQGVGACLGKGFLNIIRDMGLKEPYTGTVPLLTGEIGDDIAYYFTYSEQIPSLVALGVNLNSDRSVKSAGGLIIQIMPGTDEKVISEIEENLSSISSISALIEEVKTPQKLLDYILGKENYLITKTSKIGYNCGCSIEKMEKNLAVLGNARLEDITREKQDVEMVCHFCGKKYLLGTQKVKNIIKRNIGY